MSDDEAQARLDNYLGHMLEAAQLARQYVQGVSKDEFQSSLPCLSECGSLQGPDRRCSDNDRVAR